MSDEKNNSIDDLEAGEIVLDEDGAKNPFAKDNSGKKEDPAKDDPAVQLEKLKKEYLYLRAEFDNFRKNTIKERSDLLKYGAERFIVQIVRVLDYFDLALKTSVNAENYHEFVQGVEMTANEFKQILADMGVTEVDPTGLAFDPNIHEALSNEETSQVEPGHVVSVFKKAFKLHDKVIRPAQVVVATAPQEPSTNSDSNESSGEAE